MNRNKANIVLIAVFVVGLALLLYPSVSDYWNSFHQSRAIMNYAEHVAALDTAEYEKSGQRRRLITKPCWARATAIR